MSQRITVDENTRDVIFLLLAVLKGIVALRH